MMLTKFQINREAMVTSTVSNRLFEDIFCHYLLVFVLESIIRNPFFFFFFSLTQTKRKSRLHLTSHHLLHTFQAVLLTLHCHLLVIHVDYPAGRLVRDSRLYTVGAGTQEIRRMLIGREFNEALSGL